MNRFLKLAMMSEEELAALKRQRGEDFGAGRALRTLPELQKLLLAVEPDEYAEAARGMSNDELTELLLAMLEDSTLTMSGRKIPDTPLFKALDAENRIRTKRFVEYNYGWFKFKDYNFDLWAEAEGIKPYLPSADGSVPKTAEDFNRMFTEFNKYGSKLQMVQMGKGSTLYLGMVDSWEVTYVEGDAFWMYYKAVGYDEGNRYAHTRKIVSWFKNRGWMCDLVSDRGDEIHIEVIMHRQRLHNFDARAWIRWQKHKEANRKMFERIDDNILFTHLDIVEAELHG